MMDLTTCLLGQSQSPNAEWLAPCFGPEGSAAHLVESTLHSLQPKQRSPERWQLGYGLKVPLLALLLPDQNEWRVNQQAIQTIVRTVRDNPRPLVLYLFSTHFGVDAPIEPLLARNPANLAHTARGALPVDTYYTLPIYPWSVANINNPITQYRVKVINALMSSLCDLRPMERDRIKGITLLGEVHQMFPNFQAGMGFIDDYQVSDYSPISVTGFRQYLQSHYLNIGKVNEKMGSDYASFDAVDPPSKDIRRDLLHRYQDHIDSYAAGLIPISGWVYANGIPNKGLIVKIYLDGQHIADAPVHLSRQDVRTARPEFDTADVGWRHDLDFSQLPIGIHRIDLALSLTGRPLIHLDTRRISIMDAHQTTPTDAAMTALPPMAALTPDIAAFADEPHDGAAFYFNPLAREWQLFRETQVANYLQYFNNVVAQTCMSETPRYTHQIVPQFNPSWDSGKYAAAASLRPLPGLRTGISLYGETSYGRSFAEWFQQRPQDAYGVTEFHPLQALSQQRLNGVLNQHMENGATFLTFFLDTRWQGQRVAPVPNLFSFDPENSQYGSKQLYFSMRSLLGE